MKIERLIVGPLQTNCYVLTFNNYSIIIDPGDEAQTIIDFCKDKNIKGVLITHHHFDHIGALKSIEDYFNIKEGSQIDGFDYEIIATPGHTDDSISYYFKKDNSLFCGDFIFYHSIGRTDLPTGNMDKMKSSLELISKLPDNTIIYPGHGDKTTLKEEKQFFSYYTN